ncbi:MAG: D-alanine--D-alanine ligase [Planctomycetes bacterium]|nr:D-alanine--D-alanine ligase [Planctomycetota bacterium]
MDVAVLAGGRSPEHDISLSSTAEVLRHLDRSRWRVWPVFLDRDGGWWPSARPLPPGAAWQPRIGAVHGRAMRPGSALGWLLDQGIAVVLPVLHGPHGEDGTVQGMLELHDVPCVGSGCAASAVAMDKIRTRQALQSAGIPLARAYEPSGPFAAAGAPAEFARMRAAVGLPAFVKVDASGSTFGVQRIESEEQLATFLGEFRGRFRRWFAESEVRGEEITVAVLGNTGGPLQALPPVGIYPQCDGWFTHEAKYRPGASEEIVPPRGLSQQQIDHVQDLAVRCHETLVCDGMSRTDMIVTPNGPVVLEVNTLPGLTQTSLLPKAAAAAGLSFSALLDRLLALALERRNGTVGESARGGADRRTTLDGGASISA